MKTIGLTGGIGSGKSTVAKMLQDLGAAVIHADTVGHEVYLPHSEGWRRVVDAFGREIVGLGETIDRARLGAAVFANPEALKQLNAIVHPLIFEEIQRRIAAQRAGGFSRPIVVEAAVLIEANWLPLVDEVWLVVATTQAVIERLGTQRGLAAEDVGKRIAAQLSDAERRQFADVVIENTGSINDLSARVQTAWHRSTTG
jgi:dephospho-CoA kinase